MGSDKQRNGVFEGLKIGRFSRCCSHQSGSLGVEHFNGGASGRGDKLQQTASLRTHDTVQLFDF